MNQKRSKNRGWTTPSESETKSVLRNFAALKRIAQIAAQAGADANDITAARVWPLLWCWEVMRRKELEPFAEIGQKVSNSQTKIDRTAEYERNAEILSCACRLLVGGAKSRGLAAKIKRETKVDLTERQINRILGHWMPIILDN